MTFNELSENGKVDYSPGLCTNPRVMFPQERARLALKTFLPSQASPTSNFMQIAFSNVFAQIQLRPRASVCFPPRLTSQSSPHPSPCRHLPVIYVLSGGSCPLLQDAVQQSARLRIFPTLPALAGLAWS